MTKLALESARARRSAEGAKARARAASKAKGLGTNLSLPPKLLPSRETGRGSGAELFLCEGDSALGTIKAARDATFQAAFPLKGKPPNVFGFTVSKARVEDEFDSIERILGCGCVTTATRKHAGTTESCSPPTPTPTEATSTRASSRCSWTSTGHSSTPGWFT